MPGTPSQPEAKRMYKQYYDSECKLPPILLSSIMQRLDHAMQKHHASIVHPFYSVR
jgi:hypothetical protein